MHLPLKVTLVQTSICKAMFRKRFKCSKVPLAALLNIITGVISDRY